MASETGSWPAVVLRGTQLLETQHFILMKHALAEGMEIRRDGVLFPTVSFLWPAGIRTNHIPLSLPWGAH